MTYHASFASGNHETPGIWRQGALTDDVVDLSTVVTYLTNGQFGYEVDLLVGHSRGSVVAFHWLCTSEEGKRVSGFVNVSGRYRMGVRSCLYFSLPSFHLIVFWLSSRSTVTNYSIILSSSQFHRGYSLPDTPAAQIWKRSFETQGYHEWQVTVAREAVTVKIYPEDLATFSAWDTSIVWDHFPASVHVLSLHGLSDKTVPPYVLFFPFLS